MTKRQRRGGCFAPALTALVLVGGLTGGLVVWDMQRPVGGQCYATVPERETERLDGEQTDNAAMMAAIAEHRGLPARATTIAIATALQESKLSNIDYGDRDSVGLFQQRPSQGWGSVAEITDPVYSTNAFFDVLVRVEGWQSAEITDAAQEVQRSAFPRAYAQHEDRARVFASALTGHSPAALTCQLGEPEGGWETEGSPQRLAAIEQRLMRDFAGLPTHVVQGGALSVDSTVLSGGSANPARTAWAVAHWAVGTATDTGAATVVAEGQIWQREDGAEAQWQPLSEDDLPAGVTAPGPGQVLIR